MAYPASLKSTKDPRHPPDHSNFNGGGGGSEMKASLGRSEPRIKEDIQRVLHLSDLANIGDWFLYQNHIEIKVYRCELAPYKFPKYVSVRIFTMEYIFQMINSDDIHFVSLKKNQ
jgi:hypothetical protein